MNLTSIFNNLIRCSIIVFIIIAFTACDEADLTSEYYTPSANPSTSFYYDVEGGFSLSESVDVYIVDLFDAGSSSITTLQSSGIKVMCEMSIGAVSSGDSDYSSFTANSDILGDDTWLDIRSSTVSTLINARLQVALDNGCDGVLFTNAENFNEDTTFSITENNQISYNRSLAEDAHTYGLTVGIQIDDKFAQTILDDLVSSFDFLIVKDTYTNSYTEYTSMFLNKNKPVIDIETTSTYQYDEVSKTLMCSTMIANNIYTIYVDGSTYSSCNEDF